MKFDGLRAVRQGQLAERPEVLKPVDDRQKMITRQLPDLAGKTNRAIGDQYLGLADPAGIEDDLARCRIARRILGTDAKIEAAERDPEASPLHRTWISRSRYGSRASKRAQVTGAARSKRQ